jgi:hypothetical protein
LKNFIAMPFITPTRLETLKVTGDYAFNLNQLGSLTATGYTDLYNLLAGASPFCSSVTFTASPANPYYADLAAAATAHSWTDSTIHGLSAFFTKAALAGLHIRTKAGHTIQLCEELGNIVNFDEEIEPNFPFTAFLKDKWTLQMRTVRCLNSSPCNLSALMESLADKGTQLETLGQELANISFSSLSTSMSTLVSNLDAANSKILKLDDQVCTVEMADVWKHLMWATCYTGVPGFVSLGHIMFSMGMICIVASLMIFAAWRRIAINNANLPQEDPEVPNTAA